MLMDAEQSAPIAASSAPSISSSPTQGNGDSESILSDQGSPGTLPQRSLTYLNGLALVVGLQIGSGIFSAPSVVSQNAPSPTAAITLWFLAGILVWTGASSFAELGTTVPENGGMQEYLRYCYGDIYGFVFAWTWILVVKPCVMALVSFIFAEYLYRILLPGDDVSMWVLKATAVLALASVTFLNCQGTHLGTGAANVFLTLKIFGLGSVAVIGLFWAIAGHENSSASGLPPSFASKSHSSYVREMVGHQAESPPLWTQLANYTDATFAALFAYGGWESISFVVGEMKDPLTNLPRVLNSAMGIVMTLFILANIAFLTVLSPEVLQSTNAIAAAFGMETFGRPGAIFYTLIVSMACLGALNSTIFSTGRLTQAAGKRLYMPAFLGANADLSQDTRGRLQGYQGAATLLDRLRQIFNVASDQNLPRNAMILNACVAAIYIAVGSFYGLLIFKGMAEYLVYFLTVLGVLILHLHPRASTGEPLEARYRTSTLNPLIFCCTSAFIAIRSAITHATQAAIILIFLGCVVLIYKSRRWQEFVRRVGMESPSELA